MIFRSLTAGKIMKTAQRAFPLFFVEDKQQDAACLTFNPLHRYYLSFGGA